MVVLGFLPSTVRPKDSKCCRSPGHHVFEPKPAIRRIQGPGLLGARILKGMDGNGWVQKLRHGYKIGLDSK